jgi:hypothetical protein
MNKLFAHAVTASLALFTLADGPADRAEAPASAPREPDQGASTARPVETAKPAGAGPAAAKPAAAGPAAAKAAPPATAAEPGKAASASATARPADPKPCEPIKPCSID